VGACDALDHARNAFGVSRTLFAFGDVAMNRPAIIVISVFVWSAAFAATGALSYSLRRPQQHQVAIASPVATAARALLTQSDAVVAERVIVLPTIEFITALPRPAQPKPTPSAVAVVSRHCSDWRPLEQGSSSVQICD
jgi:hypothetical protein